MKTIAFSGLVLGLFLIGQAFMGHDFHTSTTKIEFDSEANTVKIASKYFTEDLEKALGQNASSSGFEPAVKAYVLENFALKINGASVKSAFIGSQNTDKATRVFLEVQGVSAVSQIEVRNTVLINTFKDQQNFIDFKVNGSSKSLICRKGKESGSLAF